VHPEFSKLLPEGIFADILVRLEDNSYSLICTLMRNVLIVSGIAILGLITFSFTPVGGNLASAINASRDTATNACLKDLQTLHPNIMSVVTEVSKVDINDDGMRDRIVRITETDSCGNSGCLTEICLAEENGKMKVIPFGYATEEFRILETRSESYYDILLNDNVTLSWDGAHYTPIE